MLLGNIVSTWVEAQDLNVMQHKAGMMSRSGWCLLRLDRYWLGIKIFVHFLVGSDAPGKPEATRKRNNKNTAVGSLDRPAAGFGVV